MGLGGSSEAAKAVSHPTLIFQKPLHAPTGLLRSVSRFRVEQQTTQAHEIQRRLDGSANGQQNGQGGIV
jgi:hypothetical protein